MTSSKDYFDTSSNQIMGENVVNSIPEPEHSSEGAKECVDEKLVALECRVAEIEKQLIIIFDLINSSRPCPQKFDHPKSDSASQPVVNYHKAHHHRRQITKPTRIESHPNLEKLNLNPIVKILKLPYPTLPSAAVDENVSAQSWDSDSDWGNDDIMNGYIPAEEETSVITSTFPKDDELADSSIKIEEDRRYFGQSEESDFSPNINSIEQEENPLNHTEGEDENPPVSAAQKSSKHLKQMQRQRELRRLKPKVYLLGHFNCPQCPKISRSAKLLQRHIKTRHKPHVHPYNCPDCPKSFGSKGALSIHIRGAHLDPAGVDPCPFKCCTCGKAFKHASRLTRHQEIHSETRPYKCPYCDSAFHQQQGLDTHKAIHLASSRGKPQCALCGQLFMKKQGLTRHVQRVHEKVRAYPCTLCEKRFKTSTHLKYHLGTHSNPKSKKRGLNRDRDADYDEGVVKIKRMRSGVSKIKQIIEEEPEPGTSTSQEIEKIEELARNE